MLPNPTRQITVDFTPEQVLDALKKVPKMFDNYKLENINSVLKTLTFSTNEFLSAGVFIEVSFNSSLENKTQVNIEVRRKIGAFDQSHEITYANNHIQNILNSMSTFLSNPDFSPVKKTSNTSLFFKVFAWLMALPFILTIFAAGSMWWINLLIISILLNKSIRNLFNKLKNKNKYEKN